MTMKREDWIVRLQECSEEDLPYLTMLFNDWRQEELGEDLLFPSLLTRAKAKPLRWLEEGPELVAYQPIRELELEDFWSILSINHPGYRACSFIGEAKEIGEAVSLWFPKPKEQEDRGMDGDLIYYRDDFSSSLIQEAVNRNALLWAREESRSRGLAPPYATPQVPAHVINVNGDRL